MGNPKAGGKGLGIENAISAVKNAAGSDKAPTTSKVIDDVVSRARKKVQRAIEEAERDQRNKLLQRRLELATSGVRHLAQGKIGEAVSAFLGYFKILEEWKGVGPGGLTPSLFNPKKDIYEMLLICAIYWDLAKLHDHAKTPEKKRAFNEYMEKFVLFAKGAPFQPLASETLRKYVANNKGIHKAEFKTAYRLLSGEKCFIATALVDQIEEETMPRLWQFRDQVLLKSSFGRGFIYTYYLVGPTLAKGVNLLPAALRHLLGQGLDHLSVRLYRYVPGETQTDYPKN